MIETNRITLGNGLRVVHNYDRATAMVALNILYDVGARDERSELTGMAHLFEHLMFGGSVNIPDFDCVLEDAGGKSNAWTSNDFTNFYDVLPAQNVETAFRLESDRMLSLAFSDKALEVQKSVVIEEFKQQCLNQPYGDASHLLRGLVYRVHPYRYPVIGRSFEDIERVTQADVRDFFYSHYAPNNAILSVSGNITFEETCRLAEKWFGEIERRPIAPRLYSPEPAQSAPRLAETTGHVSATRIYIAYPMEGYGTKQYVCADLLTDILANGNSSRFYRNLLLGTDLFTSVNASITGSEEPGMLLLNAQLRDAGPDAESRAIEAINDEIERLFTHQPDAREICRSINHSESAETFGYISYMAKAQALALAEYHGEDINTYYDRYRLLTPDDILSAARQIIAPSRANTLIYRPAP